MLEDIEIRDSSLHNFPLVLSRPTTTTSSVACETRIDSSFLVTLATVCFFYSACDLLLLLLGRLRMISHSYSVDLLPVPATCLRIKLCIHSDRCDSAVMTN